MTANRRICDCRGECDCHQRELVPLAEYEVLQERVRELERQLAVERGCVICGSYCGVNGCVVCEGDIPCQKCATSPVLDETRHTLTMEVDSDH